MASEGKTPESDTLDASTYIETAGKRTDAKVTLNQEITHIIKPFISTFSGTEPVLQKEVCFDDWKLETNYLIKSSPYPDIMINQAIRNSLRGKARKVVNTLKPDVTAAEIIVKLDSVFLGLNIISFCNLCIVYLNICPIPKMYVFCRFVVVCLST